MAQGSATFDANRNLTVQTGPPPSSAGGFLAGIDPALLARLVQAKLNNEALQRQKAETAAMPRYEAPAPRMRAEQPFDEAPQMPRPAMGSSAGRFQTRGVQQSMPRYSYFQAPTQMAGTAPVLPVMVGSGRQDEDFILEGGDVRALTNRNPAGFSSAAPTSAADDPRMQALVEQQRKAGRNG